MSSIVVAAQWEGPERRDDWISPVFNALAGWARDGVDVTLAHRGVLGKATIASRASSAADSSALVFEDDGFALVADCRLDHGLELRQALNLARDASETAVLAHAYRRWGDDLGKHVYGDFSLVLWDWKRRRVVAMRDALGTRPLYCWRGRRGVCVASDVEQILELCEVSPKPDERMVLGALLWRYQDVDRSFWSEISRLPGGHVLIASETEVQVRRYWDPRRPEVRISREDAWREVRTKVFVAVRRRLESHRPLVMQLSGGVDSSSIVCVADRIAKAGETTTPSIYVASAVFPGLDCDETPFIEAVTGEIGFSSHSFHGTPRSPPDLRAAPLAGPLSRVHMTGGVPGDLDFAVSLGAATVLGGTGGDQLGSPTGVFEDLNRGYSLIRYTAAIFGLGLSGRRRSARLRYLARRIVPVVLRQEWATRRAARSLPAWLVPTWREVVADRERAFRRRERGFCSETQRGHWVDLSSAHLAWSIDNETRCAALMGIEVRYPFLDRELAEYVLSLPGSVWPSSAPHARLHREALRDVLPAAIYDRRTKAEFAEAIAHRIQASGPQIRDLFHDGTWALEAYVDRPEAQKLLDALGPAFDPRRWSDWMAVWNIANIETWLRGIFRYAHPRSSEGLGL